MRDENLIFEIGGQENLKKFRSNIFYNRFSFHFF